ncbi:hypothetical protein HDK77DRAFT_451836 [Phyllosticta capitalensis]
MHISGVVFLTLEFLFRATSLQNSRGMPPRSIPLTPCQPPPTLRPLRPKAPIPVHPAHKQASTLPSGSAGPSETARRPAPLRPCT